MTSSNTLDSNNPFSSESELAACANEGTFTSNGIEEMIWNTSLRFALSALLIPAILTSSKEDGENANTDDVMMCRKETRKTHWKIRFIL